MRLSAVVPAGLGDSQLESPSVAANGTVYAFTQGQGAADEVLRISPNGQTTVIAGHGRKPFNGDKRTASQISFGQLGGVAALRDGDVLVADENRNEVLRIDPSSGRVTRFAGRGGAVRRGKQRDGGPATKAQLDRPSDVAEGAGGTVLVSELEGGVNADGTDRDGDIRRVARNGTITTIHTCKYTQCEAVGAPTKSGYYVLSPFGWQHVSPSGRTRAFRGPTALTRSGERFFGGAARLRRNIGRYTFAGDPSQLPGGGIVFDYGDDDHGLEVLLGPGATPLFVAALPAGDQPLLSRGVMRVLTTRAAHAVATITSGTATVATTAADVPAGTSDIAIPTSIAPGLYRATVRLTTKDGGDRTLTELALIHDGLTEAVARPEACIFAQRQCDDSVRPPGTAQAADAGTVGHINSCTTFSASRIDCAIQACGGWFCDPPRQAVSVTDRNAVVYVRAYRSYRACKKGAAPSTSCGLQQSPAYSGPAKIGLGLFRLGL